MVQLFEVLAWTSLFASIRATQPNIGWQILIPANSVSLASDYVGDDGRRLFIDAMVQFSRISATADSFTLTFSTSPYLVTNGTEINPNGPNQVVHTETIAAPQSSFSHSVYFDIAEPSQDLLLSVGLDDGSQGSEFLTVDGDGVVLARDHEVGGWRARVIAEYDHDVNIIINTELDEAIRGGVDEADPRDLGELPVHYVPEDETNPQPKDGAPPPGTSPIIPGGGSSTTTPGNRTSTTPCGSASTTIPLISSTTGLGVESFPVLHPSVPNTLITVYRTVTVCACSSPPPQSCSDDQQSLQSRQEQRLPAYVRARITFADRNLKSQPVRLSPVVVWADLYHGNTKIGRRAAAATTNFNGEAVFKFYTVPGETVKVFTLYTYLQSEQYQIGSRYSSQDPLVTKVVKLDIESDSWVVSAGQLTAAEAEYYYSEYNLGLAVNDAYRTITDFFRTQVAIGNNEMEQVHVWFPAVDGGAYFSEAEVPFINLPQIHAANPSVMAHEYGHFAHYLARQKLYFEGGGEHRFCGDLGKAKKDTTLSEGYATALGMMALDETPLVDDFFEYMTYSNRQYSPARSWSWNVESIDCSEKGLLQQEGRTGATLFDLVDRKLDTFPESSNNFGRVEAAFDPQLLNVRWTPRFIFWTLMQGNPQDIEQYWRRFQATQTPENEAKAWAIFDYNYADFPRWV
ncbi:Fc.00g033630.m01.CDS01 [Cosmosporella sp. VM-42]